MNGVEAWIAGELQRVKSKVSEAHRTGVRHGVLTKEEEGFLYAAFQNLGDAVACIKGHGEEACVNEDHR